jgi:MSHA pilin protein MshD
MCTEAAGRQSASGQKRQAGLSLMDTLLAIIVVSVAVTAVISVFTITVQHSADPMTQQQAQFVAEAYLEEILLKKFYDPNSNTVCPAPEASRSLYDNVCDYNGLNQAPTDQFGNAFSSLSAYNVQVTVTRDNTVTLNGLTNGAAANEIRVLRVDVTVTGPNKANAALSGYRTNYNCNVTSDPGCKGP